MKKKYEATISLILKNQNFLTHLNLNDKCIVLQ